MFRNKTVEELAMLFFVAMLPLLAQVGAFVALAASNIVVSMMCYRGVDMLSSYGIVPLVFAVLVARQMGLVTRAPRRESLPEMSALLIAVAVAMALVPGIQSVSYEVMAMNGVVPSIAGGLLRFMATLATISVICIVPSVVAYFRRLKSAAMRSVAV